MKALIDWLIDWLYEIRLRHRHHQHHYYTPPPRQGHYAMMLSDVCLYVAYIGPKSSTERPKKTKIGTEVAHVTRDSDTIFKIKRSKVKVTERRGILCRLPAQLVKFTCSFFQESSSHWCCRSLITFVSYFRLLCDFIS